MRDRGQGKGHGPDPAPGRPLGGDGESALVARAQAGDVDAFNRLVERHQEAAYALALRMLGDPDTAADITQDAFLSAFRAITGFRGGSLRAWLLRIVGNGCYDHWRARGRRPSTSLDALLDGDPASDAPPALPTALVDERWNPEGVALRAELVEAIQLALLELQPDMRMALVLCDVQGLAYDEIAEITQTSLGTVKSRISRARGHMRDLLRARGELLPSAYRRPNERDQT
ncbi:MAG TPA: sigma-70 family RNA polymerase sigma factor [Ktedonobacterales bacterium]